MGAVQTIRTVATNFDELSSLIANPPADRPIANAIGTGGRALCDAYGNLNLGAQLLTGPARPILNLLCKPYFDGAGYDPPTENPPFSGGQCPETYRVFVTNNGTDLVVGGQTPRDLQGPLGGVTRIDTVIGSPDPQTTRIQFVFSGPNDGPEATINLAFGQTIGFRIEALSGNPVDQCGDPPGQLETGPNPPPDPGPFPPGEEPGVDPTGQPFFFVPDIETPGFDPIPVEDEPLGGPTSIAPDPTPPTPQPTGDNSPAEPDAVGNPIGDPVGSDSSEDIDFGEPPMGKIWVGCLVEFDVDTRYGNIPNTGPENTVFPTPIGNVSLKYGAARGTSTQARSRWVELFRPNTALEVTGVFVQTRLNVSATVRPISVTVCKEPQCLGE